MRTISCLVFVMVAACGGDDGSTIGPGNQDFNPAPETQGTGQPSGATTVSCSQAQDCGYWFCQCDDGAVVNSALCVNNFCMGAAAACPRACEYFGHGGWTGQAGGGPGTTTTPSTCGGLGSDIVACDTCMKNNCCSEATACGQTSQCLNFWDCVLECDGNSICRDNCEFAYPAGITPYENLRSCLLDDCYSACVGGV